MSTTEQSEVCGAVDLVSAALVECQGELKAAEFDATNPFFKSKYATLGAIIAASRASLAKSGLAILQKPTIEGHLVSVHTAIIHKSGQSLDCGVMSLSLGESDRNSDAQLAGSIITYLRRYSWASVLGIYADTDDDGNSGPKGAVPRKPAEAPKPTPNPLSDVGAKRPPDIAKCRMSALNKLQAAPGQSNRTMLHDFLVSKKWVTALQTPEDWPDEYVPVTKEAFDALYKEVCDFHEAIANQGVIP